MTYTKFKVDVNSGKSSGKAGNMFFDANASPVPRGRVRTRRERSRRRKRLLAGLARGLLRCFIIMVTSVLLSVIALFSLDMIRFDGEGISVGSFFFKGASDGIEESPAEDAVTPYYLSLPSDNAGGTGAALDKGADAEASIATDSAEAEVYGDTGERGFPLLGLDLSMGENFRINNDSTYPINTEELLASSSPIAPIVPFESPDIPTVLIVHTHGTESFTTNDGEIYPESESAPRSTDTSKNVVGLGRELAEYLNSYGISTLHCETMHDEKSYLTAYKSSADAISSYVKEYPSIRYVIDLHRDSIIRDTNEKIKPVATICGEKTAQLMFVVGTDAGGAKHDGWRDNLAVAAKLQEKITDNYPALMRPINLRAERFNGQYTKGSFILEVGSCGNTYEEASRAIKLFASCFSRAVSR